MRAVTYPQDNSFSAAAGFRCLVFVFDWDTVVVPDNATASLSNEVNLCHGYLPCALWLTGENNVAVDVSENGQFLCLASAGCLQVSIRSMAFNCRNNTKSLLKMQGSVLIMSNGSFNGCQADSDGGVVQAYDMAKVDIEACRFKDVYSSGFGGAVAAHGSSLTISDSLLYNCSARSGGGAVWISAFQDCYGGNQTLDTQLRISSSIFSRCNSAGFGGAVLADSSESLQGEVLSVAVLHSSFSHCFSVAEGGALRIFGAPVVAQLQFTEIQSCVSLTSGGAISSSGLSSLSLMACSLNNNIAQGAGGGAVHVNQSFFSAYNTSISNNSAPSGGGGAFLWQKWVKPAAIECPEGMGGGIPASCAPDTSDASACQVGSCVPCRAGTFQGLWGGMECTACHSGSFSETDGASECYSCPAGTYSSFEGASACVFCGAGKYSDRAGSWICSSCPAGTYSSAEAAKSSQICVRCLAGTYSSVDAANSSSLCVLCGEGTYSDEAGSWNCSSCPAGTYSSPGAANSSQTCISCPAGTYSPIYGANSSAVCVLCIAGSYSDVPGSKSCSICPAGLCSNAGANSSSSCRQCRFGSRSGARRSVSFDSKSYSTYARVGSFLKKSNEKHSLLLKQKPNNQDGESVISLQAPVLQCSLEQRQILEMLESVSIKTFEGIERFLSMLMLKTGASSSKEAVQLVLGGSVLSSNIIRTKRRAPRAAPADANQSNSLRGILSQKHRHAQAAFLSQGSKGANLRDAPARNTGNSVFGLCGPNNSALYGSCIASDYRKLEVSGIVDAVYTGVPFNFSVTKKDAYENTILSDSSSVLEAIPALPGNGEIDPHTSIVESAVFKLSGGVAWIQFAVKATFSVIDYDKKFTSIYAPIFLNLISEGVDSLSGQQMKSGLVPVNVQQGGSVCPPGFILLSDPQGKANGAAAAVCTLCKPGSYSVSPLARLPDSDSPSCLDCPIGCHCNGGGEDIHCNTGFWKAVDGIYKVITCPAGFQLINSSAGGSHGKFSSSLQQCKACLPGQYIINPDTDTCQDCPPGQIDSLYL